MTSARTTSADWSTRSPHASTRDASARRPRASRRSRRGRTRAPRRRTAPSPPTPRAARCASREMSPSAATRASSSSARSRTSPPASSSTRSARSFERVTLSLPPTCTSCVTRARVRRRVRWQPRLTRRGRRGPRVISYLERELREQPEALARLIEKQRGYAEQARDLFRRGDVQYLLIASRGSSSNAARYAQYLLGRSHRVPVAFATPSLFTLYGQPPRLDGALVIGISQSGRSPDVVEVVAEARRQGRPTVALTNDPSSPLGEAADGVLKLEAGDEHAVAATKTYVNSLGAIALLFSAATGQGRTELERVPEQLAAQIEQSRRAVEALDLLEGGTVVARGV